MIFLTVGHQMPFDRLVRCVDAWAGDRPDVELFGQLGDSGHAPRHFPSVKHLTRLEFDRKLDECEAVIAHAGTGTIIQAALAGKPTLVFPRLAQLGETRTNHQVGTAQHFSEAGLVLAAFDEPELLLRLDELPGFAPRSALAKGASPELIDRISRFLASTDACDERRTP